MNLLHANDRAGGYPASWYAATATPLAPFAALKGAARADVCVVGGGYTGLSAALHMAERGLSVILLEAHRVGFGASGRNGGQVGSGQRLEQDALERMAGKGPARALWDMAEDAKALVRGLIETHAMPLRFHPGLAHACYSTAEVRHAHQNAEKLARDYDYHLIEPLDRAGIRALIGSDVFKGGEIDRGAGHLHPLNFAIGLAKAAAAAGAHLHETSEVLRIDHGPRPVVHTADGAVTCDHVILAGKQAYSMSAVDEYGKVIDDIYDFAEAQGFEIDGILQEGGAGQVEINLAHGDPIRLADEIFFFKRLIREAALRHDCFAT
ncbi:MAG: FAD-dependent oxidoreductase, partial [Paracoccaceae bacterium]|nr:FAD-dependent oxidoreductase [Paracoccaceae bacterium]